MNDEQHAWQNSGTRLRLSDDQLRLAEANIGTGAFELDIRSRQWITTPQVAMLFGLNPATTQRSLSNWERVIFTDDTVKLRGAIDAAEQTGVFGVELRVRHPDDSVHWLAAKGEVARGGMEQPQLIRGICFDITERKTLEARLLQLNETLEARVAELREEARTLELLNRTGIALAGELELERLVQTVTDAGTEISGAQFGAFFYNVSNEEGETYKLFALSGVPREAFANFPMPRNTAIFGPTFHGSGPVRSNDILTDPRYGKNPPYHGMPKGHLPVRSYLAVPVVSRSGEVLGGLFFGHADPGIFTQRDAEIVTGIAAQAAVAIDNARLYQTSRQEVEARKKTEQQLQALNDTLEQRIEERAAQLESSFAELRESERRFRLLVETVTDYAILMLDSTGIIIKWNPGAERIKGYTADEIIGRHFSCFYTEDDQRDHIPAQALATAARTGKYQGEGWRVRKDGKRFWASVLIEAIRDRDGSVQGFVKVTRDWTEKRAADERLRQAQKMEAIGQLTGGVAHDFNNLLTVVSGNLELLQRHLSKHADNNLQRFVTSALQASSRAAVLTQRLLAFSRRQALEPRSVSIDTLVAGMSEIFRRALPENIAIQTSLAAGLWRTFVDPNQLENSLLNLVINARDAMPRGGRLVIDAENVSFNETTMVAAEPLQGQYVGISVTDDGIGMAPDVVARAFDPFFTTKDVGQGTGLGLSQVYGFVKQSDGQVRINSEIGVGTTVTIYLPRLRAPDTADERQPDAAAVPLGKGETVLVVEDESGVRSYVVETLKELGYRVLDAPDAPAGLRLLDAHGEIALLFTDVVLPGGMNGRQLADEARRRNPGLKVLFTSGYARDAIVHDGRLDPDVQLITKPFNFASLAAKLRDVLDHPAFIPVA